MTTTTQTDVAATDSANGEKTAARPRKQRMAREPKPSDQMPGDSAKPDAQTPKASERKEPRGPSKIASVIALLQRAEGATLAELVEATGWLPHTTRAALTGLKKKGRIITKDKRDNVTCYHIAASA